MANRHVPSKGRPHNNHMNYVRNTREKRITVQKFLWGYKSLTPCVDCGEDDPTVLDFDHVRGDKRCALGDVAKLITLPVDDLLAEIAKCDIRCANCHRKVTQQRREAKRIPGESSSGWRPRVVR